MTHSLTSAGVLTTVHAAAARTCPPFSCATPLSAVVACRSPLLVLPIFIGTLLASLFANSISFSVGVRCYLSISVSVSVSLSLSLSLSVSLFLSGVLCLVPVPVRVSVSLSVSFCNVSYVLCLVSCVLCLSLCHVYAFVGVRDCVLYFVSCVLCLGLGLCLSLLL